MGELVPGDAPVHGSVIEPPRKWRFVDLGEVWRHRELLFFLAWRDVKVRYKQTAIGLLWVVLNPVLTIVVFSAIFGGLMNVPSDGLPYPVFTFAALLPWTLFTAGLSRAGMSLVADAEMISKVYFPRLILPLAAVASTLVDFAISFLVLVVIMLAYGILPGAGVVVLPLLLVLAVLTAVAFGVWLAALNVKYRDVTHVIPYVIQLWFFLTPVVYAASLVPARWQFVYGLNPMTGVVEGFRWALLGERIFPVVPLLLSGVIVVAVLVAGLVFFRRLELEFADVV